MIAKMRPLQKDKMCDGEPMMRLLRIPHVDVGEHLKLVVCWLQLDVAGPPVVPVPH